MLGLLEGKNEKDSAVRREHGEVEARRLLERGLRVLELRKDDLSRLPCGDWRKVALAARIRARTTASNAWIAKALEMGHPSRITQCVKDADKNPATRILEIELE
jgi:hypothetical protein